MSASAPVRVLVVDDSVVVRRLVTEALEADPGVEVAGTAANGRIALARLDHMAPDLVTLDVEMPEMNGLEALVAIRRKYPRLPVVMFSTLTERGASTTLDALAAGASDYVTKPANMGSVQQSIEAVREQLLPRIHALCPRQPAQSRVAASAPAVRVGQPSPRRASAVPAVLVVGASTGGPAAIERLLCAMPGPLPVPVLVVQHMPPVFTKHLADRLDRLTAFDVREGVDGEPIRPGQVWIAPGGRHMEVVRGATGHHVRVHDGPPENAVRPAVDVLFRSAAAAYGAATLGVVLTGMGMDGARGTADLIREGGAVLAQDEASSVVWGMPGAVANLAEAVVPLDGMARAISTRLSAVRPVAGAGVGVAVRP